MDKPGPRLQKYLTDCGVASRRKCGVLIQEGKVRVNGITVRDPSYALVLGRDRVLVGNRPALPLTKGLLLIHKPKGVMCTLSDPQGRPTIADFLGPKHRGYFPVGRLDYDSTGLVIMTNEGDLAERLMHPRYGCERVYDVRVSGVMQPKTLLRLKRGVRLKDGIARADARILRGDSQSTWLRVKVTEGRNRLIRRMMEHLYHPVLKLKRIAHGPFSLGRLGVGEIFEMDHGEFRRFRDSLAEKTGRTSLFRAQNL